MSLRSDRGERAKGVALAHRALNAPHDDAAGAFGADFSRADFIQRVHGAENLAATHLGPHFRCGHEEAIVGRRVMDLEMGFVGVFGCALDLRAQFRGPFGRDDLERSEQVTQAAVEVAQVARVDIAGATALDVDGGDLAGVSGAQCAARKERTVPAPEGVEAGGHRALGAIDGFLVRDEPGPRQQFIGAAGAVEVDVMGDLREQLGIEKVGEALRNRAPRVAGKGAGEVDVVGGIRAEAGVERALVEHRHHDDRAAEIFRAPVLGPLAKEGGPLVFVAVRSTVQQEDWAGLCAAPDERVEADVTAREPTLLETRRELLKIDGKFGGRGTHG